MPILTPHIVPSAWRQKTQPETKSGSSNTSMDISSGGHSSANNEANFPFSTQVVFANLGSHQWTSYLLLNLVLLTLSWKNKNSEPLTHAAQHTCWNTCDADWVIIFVGSFFLMIYSDYQLALALLILLVSGLGVSKANFLVNCAHHWIMVTMANSFSYLIHFYILSIITDC